MQLTEQWWQWLDIKIYRAQRDFTFIREPEPDESNVLFIGQLLPQDTQELVAKVFPSATHFDYRLCTQGRKGSALVHFASVEEAKVVFSSPFVASCLCFLISPHPRYIVITSLSHPATLCHILSHVCGHAHPSVRDRM